MARPKDTKTTKWLIRYEEWFATQKEASREGKSSKLPYEIQHVPNAKTMYGNYRRNTWRLRTFYPKLYRGRKQVTMPFKTKQDALKAAKYHSDKTLVQIRGGAWMYVEPAQTVKQKKRTSAKKKRILKAKAEGKVLKAPASKWFPAPTKKNKRRMRLFYRFTSGPNEDKPYKSKKAAQARLNKLQKHFEWEYGRLWKNAFGWWVFMANSGSQTMTR